MKTMVVTLLGLAIFILGGLILYRYYIVRAQPAVFVSQNITKVGRLQKVTPPGDDYTHLLITSSGTVRLNTQKVNLDAYLSKSVSVTGQYSGNTLFVDEIHEKSE